MKLAITFFSFALLVGSISARGRRPRIIGGVDAKIEDFPYQVSLREDGIHYCGGTIISEKHIITAAHCIHDDTDIMEIHTGTDRYNESGIVHSFASIKVHPKWVLSQETSYRNDIAVITLKEKISFDKYQNKINLPSKEVQNGVQAILTGWGYTSNKPNSAAMQLQQHETTIIANTDCQEDQSDEIYEDQLCAFQSKEVGVCYGDSGSPLAIDGEVIGIASWIHGDDCATGSPDVYTNVYAYRDFIESAMNN